MDKYQVIEIVGEGSYGVVMKCRHRETGQLLAVKRFIETEEDQRVRKLAFREIGLLKKLRHENLVNMIQVFRRRKRFYLVFEYLDHTLLDELEAAEGQGLGWDASRCHVYQLLRGLDFCHANDTMHRDVKPENVLVSLNRVIKLCDFGLARPVTGANESCTDYVATRWYRAPELLVGDPRYGKPVDVWAVGCLYAEMVLGSPLFPGDSDVDQLYRITKVLGGLCKKHQTIMGRGSPGQMLRHASTDELVGPARSALQSIRKLFPSWDEAATDFLGQCVRMDPDARARCSRLLQHPLFTQNRFAETFLIELADRIAKDAAANPFTTKEPTVSPVPYFRNPDPPSWRVKLAKSRSTSLETDEQANEQTVQDSLSSSDVERPGKISHLDPLSVPPITRYIRPASYRAGDSPRLLDAGETARPEETVFSTRG